MPKTRISQTEYNQLMAETQTRIDRADNFLSVVQKCEMPNPDSANPEEALKAKHLIETIRDNNFDIFDIAVAANGYIVCSESDTHGKNRSFETFLGGRGDGEPDPDCAWGEIKLSQIVSEHKLEQVMTVGRIYKTDKKTKTRTISERFEDSSTFKKLKNCLIATYFQEGKQLGHKISNVFVFNVEDELWFQRIKEDWEFYRNEYLVREKLLSEGKIKRRPSGIMKSDSGKRCPNGTLGIRSDSIIFNKKFFMEVSKHYDS